MYYKILIKVMMEMGWMGSMFSDIGLELGLDKCVILSKGKLVLVENFVFNENDFINVWEDKIIISFLESWRILYN